MNMAIWPKFFTLLGDPDGTIDISMSEFQDFLVTVAQLSKAYHTENNAALMSQFRPNALATAAGESSTCPFPASSSNVLNLFPSPSVKKLDTNLNMIAYRKNCQKLIKHYALTSTTTTEFKISDLVSCMVYLAKSPKYRPLYAILEDTMYDDGTCIPNLTSQEIIHLVDLLRNLLDMPVTTLDYGNIQILRNTLNKAMSYPIARYPRIMVAQSALLSKDKRCTLEELIVERGKQLTKLVPTQLVKPLDTNKIPYCDNTNLMNTLMKLIDDFPVHRMFYNAVNAIFYTTMDNYATANCKFDVQDYNQLFSVVDDINEFNMKSGLVVRKPKISDSLSVYLQSGSRDRLSVDVGPSKRKKY